MTKCKSILSVCQCMLASGARSVIVLVHGPATHLVQHLAGKNNIQIAFRNIKKMKGNVISMNDKTTAQVVKGSVSTIKFLSAQKCILNLIKQNLAFFCKKKV